MKTWQFIKKNQEAMLIGGLVGFAASWYLKAKGVNFLFAAESPGLLDQFVSMPKYDLASLKFTITYVFIGVIVGIILNSIFSKR